VVVLSALEVDTNFNVNVLTGSDGVLRGASGGHCDTAVAAALSIIVAPLVRGRIPTLVDNVLTCVTLAPALTFWSLTTVSPSTLHVRNWQND
jgi:citrate lyase subunit alpha/citrate CoA-transferase